MSEVVKFFTAQKPDDVLEQAKGIYGEVLILGYDKNGELDARASLNIDSANILWLLESFKARLISGDYAE